MSNSLTIFNYSEKAIAVFGNTEQHKTKLTELGGKYNPRLKKEGEITPGWIFSKSKRTQIQEFINQIREIKKEDMFIKPKRTLWMRIKKLIWGI